MQKMELIAPCHFGLESVLKREIIDLGYELSKVEDGRVTFMGDAEAVCRANIGLRTAERILIKVAGFQAKTFEVLFERTKELLAAAGYPDGFSTQWYAVNTSDQDMSTAINAMLNEVGIQTEINFLEIGGMTELRNVNGWDGMIYQAFSSLAALPSTFRLTIDIADPPVYNVSTARPEGYAADFTALIATEVFEQSAAEKMHDWFYNEMIIIPVMETVGSYVVRDTIRDAEYGHWAVGTQWRIENMWLDE